MAITKDDFLRKAHVYMESESGRKEVFQLFKKEMKTGIDTGSLGKAVSVFRSLKGYIKGDSFIFLNHDRPNIMGLLKQRKNIQNEALDFFKENLDLIKQVYVKVPHSADKFDMMFIFIKYLPEIRHLDPGHFVDLYLLLFYTVYSLDTFEGDEEDRSNLGDIMVKAFCRYDCLDLGKTFIRDSELNRLAKDYSTQFEPYKAYGFALKDVLEKEIRFKERTGVFDESVLAPLLFTQNFINAFDVAFDGFVSTHLNEKREKIFSSVFSRFHVLFPGNRKEKDYIKDVVEHYFDRQVNRLMKHPVKRPYLLQPSYLEPGRPRIKH